jgi:hypothetical protein
MNALHGMRGDRVQHNGHSLVLHQEDRPLADADLNATERKMLEKNTIQGLLPFAIEEQDLELVLYYNYTSKRPLSQELRFHPLREDELARLLIDLVFILDHSLAYLLQPHRFVLDPEHIYVDGEIRSLELVYLPLVRMDAEPALAVRWNKLVRTLWADTAQSTGPIARTMYGLLEREAPPAEYKLRLLAALQDSRADRRDGAQQDGWAMPEPSPASGEIAAASHPAPGGSASAAATPPPRSKGAPHPARAVEANGPQSASGRVAAARGFADEQPGAAAAPAAKKLSDRLLLALAAPLLAGWSAYAWLQTELTLYIAAAISIFIVSIGYHLSKAQPHPQLPPASEASGSGSKRGLAYTGRQLASPPSPLSAARPSQVPALAPSSPFPPGLASTPLFVAQTPPFPPGLASPPPFPSVPSSPTAAGGDPVLLAGMDAELAQRTVLLSDPNATVLLRKPEEPPQRPQPFLEQDGGEPPMRWMIPESGLVIGRESAAWPTGAEHRELSRQHCEIIRSEGACALRDLGSKNGTLLNGTALIPFKEYPLQQEDRIELAGLFFRFHT